MTHTVCMRTSPLPAASWRAPLMLAAALATSGCSLDGLLNSDKLPPDVTDPAITQTPEGALAAYYGTLARFREAFGGGQSEGGGDAAAVVTAGGVLGDELQVNFGGGEAGSPFDRRTLEDGTSSKVYDRLHLVRGHAFQATGLLTRYRSEQPELLGHVYAVRAYAELFLADLFCSGIPLSTLDYDGDYTYRPGSTITEVYQHAIALLDTSLTLTTPSDSLRFIRLAQVGRARALLALGDYAAAASAVASVPDDYRYEVIYAVTTGESPATNFADITSIDRWRFTVADYEGLNGLGYRSIADPRVGAQAQGTNAQGSTIWHPTKYATDGSSPIVLASGIEARLIEAEAALQANPNDGVWLAKLNVLRTDGTFDEQLTEDPNDDPTATDTLWHAGSGGVDGLAPLEDPGTAEGRVDLLFRERAFWLFLTGHRQGDLRRLIRQYGRTHDQVYPTGSYPSGFPYGSSVTLPIPEAERASNPLFTGCISREA